MEKLRILIVDDDPSIRKSLQRSLGIPNSNACKSREEAVKALRDDNNVYDVLITDLEMETKFAGIEVAREAKNRSKPVPVIILITGTDEEVVRSRMKLIGIARIDKILFKPFDPSILEVAIQEFYPGFRLA